MGGAIVRSQRQARWTGRCDRAGRDVDGQGFVVLIGELQPHAAQVGEALASRDFGQAGKLRRERRSLPAIVAGSPGATAPWTAESWAAKRPDSQCIANQESADPD